MEPGEHFSLCWNNFHSNLSSGFQSLYKDEDLVDVTLATQGHYVKAHKTVLSVCSPFFKDLFKSNPSKHPIVILPDINYGALKSVVQFMYQGEVSVSQEDISTFMKVAEALKVKGLTDNTDTPNGIPTPPKVMAYSSLAPIIQNSQKRPSRPPSAIKKIIRPPNPSLRTLSSPMPSTSPQPNASHVADMEPSTLPPPVKKQMLDLFANTENQTQSEPHNFSQTINDNRISAPSSSLHNTTPISSPGPQPVALVRPKEEPLEDGESVSQASIDDNITIEGSVLLDTQIAEGSRSGGPSPTHQMASWPSSESMMTPTALTVVDDPSQPGTIQCILGKRGIPRLIVDGYVFYKKSVYKGKAFWYCKNSRTPEKCQAVCWTMNGNIVKWPSVHNHLTMPDPFNPEEDAEVPIENLQEVCVKKKVLNCKGCLITLNNTQIVLSCLAHNHSQMHDVIHRLYVPKREGMPAGGAAPSTSTSPALNLCNK